jgi:hypothetical protein
MDDPPLVRRFEGLRQLPRDGDGFNHRHAPSIDPQALRQRRPLDQFEDQRLAAGRVFEPVDGGDIGMIQRCKEFRLAREPCESTRIGDERFGQQLERHLAAEPRVAGSIHFAHAARTQRRQDLVGTQPRATGNLHDRADPNSAIARNRATSRSRQRMIRAGPSARRHI